MVLQPKHGILAATLAIIGLSAAHALTPVQSKQKATREASGNAQLIAAGMHIFRYDTFGDEQLWTAKLRLHEVIEKSVDPTTALSVGLKVDADVLPAGILQEADLKSPATTVALLKMNAIVGVQATVDANNHITALGVTCALCHSTVDDSVRPGVGHRQDGWANRDLDVGAIIALSPALTAQQKAVYSSWGPGKYDPRYNQDGQSTPLVIPPAYGLAQVDNATYTAEGPLSYWNAYVAVTQMGGQGNFADPRLKLEITHSPDLVSSKLPALRSYQYSLAVPRPAAKSFNADGAASGRALFNRNCSTCHVGGNGTDNNNGKLHQPADIGSDGAYSARTANKAYRTTPLRGLLQHPPYFHDGSSATLHDVVTHYDRALALQLTQQQQADLVEYLKSL
jgi:cytochrome c5